MDTDKVQAIIDRRSGHNSPLMYMLQDLHKEFNYLPKEALQLVSRKTDVPLSRIYGIASFFHAFSLEPRGKHVCSVCMGTACHVRGSQRILDDLERELNVKAGGNTADMEITLDTVNCVGACAIGPVVIVNSEYHGNMTSSKTSKLIKTLREGQTK